MGLVNISANKLPFTTFAEEWQRIVKFIAFKLQKMFPYFQVLYIISSLKVLNNNAEKEVEDAPALVSNSVFTWYRINFVADERLVDEVGISSHIENDFEGSDECYENDIHDDNLVADIEHFDEVGELVDDFEFEQFSQSYADSANLDNHSLIMNAADQPLSMEEEEIEHIDDSSMISNAIDSDVQDNILNDLELSAGIELDELPDVKLNQEWLAAYNDGYNGTRILANQNVFDRSQSDTQNGTVSHLKKEVSVAISLDTSADPSSRTPANHVDSIHFDRQPRTIAYTNVETENKASEEGVEVSSFVLWLRSMKSANLCLVQTDLDQEDSGCVNTPQENDGSNDENGAQFLDNSTDANEKKQKKKKKKKKQSVIHEKIDNSVAENNLLVSETFAEILVSQGYYEKAIKIYSELMTINPQNKSIFAARIEKLKNEHL